MSNERDAREPIDRPPRITARERDLLLDLNEAGEVGMFFSFSRFTYEGRPRAEVRRLMRSLARKGFAQYRSGLFTEDGEVAGSGYGITLAGAEAAEAIEDDRIDRLLEEGLKKRGIDAWRG